MVNQRDTVHAPVSGSRRVVARRCRGTKLRLHRTVCTPLRRTPAAVHTTPKSFKKKLQDPTFAAGVNRDDVKSGAELLGLDIDQHIANVIAAMRGIGAELGLKKL